MSLRRVLLTYTPQGQVPSGSTTGFMFQVVASNNNLMPTEIFRMSRPPNNPTASTQLPDQYLGVCTPYDLTALPVNNPPISNPAGLFRVASITLVFNTEPDALLAWQGIQADALTLKLNLDAQDTLVTSTTVWIGSPP